MKTKALIPALVLTATFALAADVTTRSYPEILRSDMANESRLMKKLNENRVAIAADVAALDAEGDSATPGTFTTVAASGNVTLTHASAEAVMTVKGFEASRAWVKLHADQGDEGYDQWNIWAENATGQSDALLYFYANDAVKAYINGYGDVTAYRNLVGDEAKVDGKYAAVGGDATTGLMVQQVSVTKGATQLSTNSFAVAFGAAPTLVCTYTEGVATNIPMITVSTTTTNFVVYGSADIDFKGIAVGTRP